MRYARNLVVHIVYNGEKAKVKIGKEIFDETCQLQKLLFNLTVQSDLERANQMSLQGPFLGMCNIQVKASHSVLYNCSISDDLVKFAVKARLSSTANELYNAYMEQNKRPHMSVLPTTYDIIFSMVVTNSEISITGVMIAL